MVKPIRFQWDGEHMVPHPRAQLLCERQYTVGKWYMLGDVEQRNTALERMFFASVREAWNNLSPEKTARWPSPNHLRKWALCKAGYCEHTDRACSDREMASIVAANCRRKYGEYAVIKIGKDNVVHAWVPFSMKREEMSAGTFKEAVERVLNVISAEIGVDPTTLRNNAGRAA